MIATQHGKGRRVAARTESGVAALRAGVVEHLEQVARLSACSVLRVREVQARLRDAVERRLNSVTEKS